MCTRWQAGVRPSLDERVDGSLKVELESSEWAIPYHYQADNEIWFTLFGENGNYRAKADQLGLVVPVCYMARPGRPLYETVLGNRQVLVRYRTRPDAPAQLGFGIFLDAERCRAAASKFVPRETCPPDEHLVRELKARAAAR